MRRTKAESKAIAEALEAIKARHRGRLTPDAVVAAAKNRRSVLHKYFEWSDAKAAAAHRVEQARTLIASVTVVIRTDRKEIRCVAYVRDARADPGKQGYRSVEDMIRDNDKDEMHEVLTTEFQRSADALRRARTLAVAFSLEEEVDTTIRAVESLRSRVDAVVENRRRQ